MPTTNKFKATECNKFLLNAVHMNLLMANILIIFSENHSQHQYLSYFEKQLVYQEVQPLNDWLVCQ